MQAKQKEEQELKERLDKLESERKVIVASYKDKDVMIVPIDLRNTTEDDFVAYITNLDEQIEAKKKAFELEETLKQEREANAEKERLAKIEADKEAERLKKELEDKLEAERKANELKIATTKSRSRKRTPAKTKQINFECFERNISRRRF